jgi:hemoglobin
VSRDIVRPPPSRDLDDRAQVAEMVRRFYADVAQDDLLGPMFNDVARVDWSEHLPKLTDFWCRMLFAEPGYEGNPLRAHQRVHARRPFTAAHFERWLELFFDTLELGWVGPNTEKVKAFATKVARVHAAQLLGTNEAAAAAGTDATTPEAGPPTLAVQLGVSERRC